MKPYYEHGGVTIYHGDCREVLISQPFVDVVLTDPPYNVGLDYGAHNDRMGADEYGVWCREWFDRVRTLAERTVIFTGCTNLRMWLGIEKPSSVGCWYKPGCTRQSVLGWDEWEPFLYYGCVVGGSSVIRCPVGPQQDVGDHPCPKPLRLFSRLLAKLGGSTVLDPFMGSGTTLVAAKQLGRRAIGIEIEERYCEIAARRLQQEVLPLFEPEPMRQARQLAFAGGE